MAAKRVRDEAQQSAEAETKLARLLETETELDTMLEDARARAGEIVNAANERAAQRLGELEAELVQQDRELRERIAREQDDAIAAIRAESKRQTERFDGISDDGIAEVARTILDRLLGARDAGGAR
jgi:F0F1-type ATP synthase membrane subunit b/b'